MKLKTLAGFGPQAALVSGAIMVVIVVAQQVTNAITFSPATLTIIQISFFVVLVLLMATLTVTVFDLESLEHPRTSTPWFRVAQATMLAATVMPVVIAVSWFAQVGLAFEISYAVFFFVIGIGLLVHNLEGRRVHLLHGALPWIGIVCGGGYVVLGILQTVVIFTLALVMGFVPVLLLAELLYAIWAIWMGVHLTRAKSPAAAMTTAPAAN